MALLGVDRGEDRHVIGQSAVGDPVFGAIEDEVLAVGLGPAADAGHIRSHQRLGGGKTDRLEVVENARQIAFADLLVFRQQHRLHPQGVVENRCGQTGAGGRQLFGQDGGLDQTQSLTPIGLGNIHVHDPGIVGFADHRQRDVVLFVVVPGHRQHFLERKFAGFLLQRQLFRCEPKIQHASPFLERIDRSG